jgi:U3 small nucleolar RNA-associated protein 20
MDELKATAIELQDLVQQKVDTTKFAVTYNKIRQTVLGVQRERRTARVTKFATNPEAAARRKQQRSVAKKEGRKRKSTMFADNRGRLKRHRA